MLRTLTLLAWLVVCFTGLACRQSGSSGSSSTPGSGAAPTPAPVVAPTAPPVVAPTAPPTVPPLAPSNQPPSAQNDSFSTDPGTTASLDVMSNDSDPDNNLHTVVISSQPSHGTASVNAAGEIEYAPQAGFSGQDSLVYELLDTGGLSSFATVWISVGPAYLFETTDQLPGGHLASGSLSLDTDQRVIALHSGNIICGNDTTNEVEIRNFVTGQLHRSYALSSKPGDLQYDRDQQLLFVGVTGANFIVRIDLVSHQQQPIALSSPPGSMILGSPGRLFVAMPGGKLALVDTTAGSVVKTFTSMHAGILAYDTAHDSYFSASYAQSPSEIYRYQFDPVAESLTLLEQRWWSGSGRSIMASHDGQRLVFAAGGNPSLVDLSTVDLQQQHGQWNTGAYDAVFSADDQHLALTRWGELTLWTVSNHVLLDVWSLPNNAANRAGISLGKKLIFAYGQGSELYWQRSNLP